MSSALHSKGFRGLLSTQFLGAFNDNAFRFVIFAIIVDRMDQTGGSALYLAIAGAMFLSPFLIFSTLAGYLADRFSKQKIIQITKVIELFIMGFGLWAFLTGSIWALLAVLFFMGTQSAFFSPSKYGIIPEILSKEELSEGNGTLQMWSYVAILLGQASYGFMMEYTQPHYFKMAYIFMAISVLGIFTSLFVTKVESKKSERSLQVNIVKEMVENIRWIKKDRSLILSILGLMYFGFLGGLFQPNIQLYARKLLEVSHLMTGLLLAFLTIGLGLGCWVAGQLSDKKIELGLVPLGAVGISVFACVLGFVSHSYYLAAMTVFFLGFFSGFYIVPLNTLIQQNSPEDRRGQVLATSNVLTFVAILLGTSSIYLFHDIFHLNAAHIFVMVGLLTIIGTVYITSLLPYAFVRLLIWILAHTVYKIRTINKEYLPQSGGALLVSNHVSYIDALLLVVTTERPIRFLMYRDIYNLKLLHPLFKIANVIPISYTDGPKEIVKSLNQATEAIKNGDLVCIFPEGQLTRTGNMLKFNRGLERIVKNTDCPIVPIHLDRVWGSIFSYERGRYLFKVPKMIPYPVTISYGSPMPSESSTFEIRACIQELGADAFAHRLDDKLTLPEAFWREARRSPFKFCMADTSGKKLNFASSLISAVALAGKLKKPLSKDVNVGVLVPPSVGGCLTNIALSILNKVPININYTSSKEAMDSIVQQCDMKKIVTSRAFMEKVKIDVAAELIYLEDLLPSINLGDKLAAIFKSFLTPVDLSRRLIFGSRQTRSMDHLATIMFTSGSTGNPKGVMLTHANITSNLEGLYQIFHIQEKDCLLGVLPFFHSFGFTATMWFPLVSGMGVVYHNNPLDAKMIGKLVKKYEATILMSTPTFLNAYIRRCSEDQFQSLRVVVVGAEKLKSSVAEAFKEKFDIDPMEGYGCTELSPIVSLNLPDYRERGVKQKAFKPGKIGLPLPGIAVKVVDQDSDALKGVNENGLLFIKGPNVMKGYLNQDEKTKEVIQEGWYKTGDIANIDEDGFLMITDRLSRFSKIAGEMVPHIKIEDKMHEILNVTEQTCVVVSLPDEKKGEKLVVLCLRDVDVVSLVDELKQSELPNLWIPDVSMFHKVDAIPLLGSGKLDLGKIKKIAGEVFSGS